MATRPNPMIAAVLKEIPGPESTRAQRVAWLRMVAMSMDTIYGAADGGPIELPDFLGVPLPHNPSIALPAQAAAPAPPKPAVRLVEPPRFFIDRDGFARQAPSMEPITAGQLGGDTIFDDRGEFGDLGSIVWADGSRGVLGLQISISATPEAKRA